NQIRGLLGEYGLVMQQGVHHLINQLPAILEGHTDKLSDDGKWLFDQAMEQLRELIKRIEVIEDKIKAVFVSSEDCQALNQIKGIGVLTATALISAAGNAKEFKNGRQFSAWLGLVPKQNSSGGKTRLLGITKQGNSYLRRLLIHGARATLYWSPRSDTPLSRWLHTLQKRVGTNRAVVALANKNARLAWAMLAKGEPFNPSLAYQAG
ncbi:MAG: IS110 family transposase, partial [Magnetococcales bacterium]|nr:IS110 family transposase [Magnetococcales bacterium]